MAQARRARWRVGGWGRGWVALGLVLALVLGVVAHSGARGPLAQAEVALATLPPEAVQTVALIVRGGPFPYRQDGRVFENRERRLPRRARGYYTEYTVRTPGSPDRGARRVVAGGLALGTPEFWYTDDHYRSFRKIQASGVVSNHAAGSGQP